jgi:hypothetical protein
MMNDYERKQLDEFFNAIEPNVPGYTLVIFRRESPPDGEFRPLTFLIYIGHCVSQCFVGVQAAKPAACLN